MLNVKQIIDGHNKAILKIAETAQPQKNKGNTCSCSKKEDCPLNGECLVSEVVYQAEYQVYQAVYQGSQPETKKRHTQVSQLLSSRQDTETT